MVTIKEAFKRGFLARCADEGLDGAGMTERLTKAAFGMKDLLMPFSAAGSLIGGATPWVVGAGLGVPLLGGAAAGSVLAKATDDDLGVQEALSDEQIAEYRRLAEQARRRTAVHALLHAKPARRGYLP